MVIYLSIPLLSLALLGRSYSTGNTTLKTFQAVQRVKECKKDKELRFVVKGCEETLED